MTAIKPRVMRMINNEPDADFFRRIKEFQGRVRQSIPRSSSLVIPARGPLSARDAHVLDRLRRHSVPLAHSLEQVLKDLNDHTRLSYIGPAGEVREVMRATVQLFAPEEEVKKQAWFKGIEQGGKRNSSQSERIRYAVQQRGGSKEQTKGTDTLIDELIGQIGRQTYSAGSSAFHAGTLHEKVRKLTGWVFVILDEVLPE
jgi:hypothetical protein